jgi:hypothetical protein
MRFENEVKLFAAFILILIPFNPTNIIADIFVDQVFSPFMDALGIHILSLQGPFGWIWLAIPLVIKAGLAIAEIELVQDVWNTFFGPRKSGKKEEKKAEAKK